MEDSLINISHDIINVVATLSGFVVAVITTFVLSYKEPGKRSAISLLFSTLGGAAAGVFVGFLVHTALSLSIHTALGLTMIVTMFFILVIASIFGGKLKDKQND